MAEYWRVGEYAVSDGDGAPYTEYFVETKDGQPICAGVHSRTIAEQIAATPILLRAVEDQDRVDKNPSISAANSLIQLLGEQRHVRSELRELIDLLTQRAENDERSSVEIDSNGSAGKVKVRSKAYARTVEDARADAHYEFVKEMAALEIAQENGWAATLEALSAQREASVVGVWSS